VLVSASLRRKRRGKAFKARRIDRIAEPTNLSLCARLGQRPPERAAVGLFRRRRFSCSIKR